MTAAKKLRDFSRAEFERRARAHGFEPTGFMGYWRLPAPNQATSVCKFNGGDSRREQLAYLLRERDSHAAPEVRS